MPRSEDVAVCCSGHLPSCHLLVILKPFRGVHRDTEVGIRCRGVKMLRCVAHWTPSILSSSGNFSPSRGVHRDTEVGIRRLGVKMLLCAALDTFHPSSSGNFRPFRGVHRDTEVGIRCRGVKMLRYVALWTPSILSSSGNLNSPGVSTETQRWASDAPE
jgi:hypothetical protein